MDKLFFVFLELFVSDGFFGRIENGVLFDFIFFVIKFEEFYMYSYIEIFKVVFLGFWELVYLFFGFEGVNRLWMGWLFFVKSKKKL